MLYGVIILIHCVYVCDEKEVSNNMYSVCVESSENYVVHNTSMGCKRQAKSWHKIINAHR